MLGYPSGRTARPHPFEFRTRGGEVLARRAQLLRHPVEQAAIQPAGDKFPPITHECGALGRRPAARKPAEPAGRGLVIQCLGQPFVRKVVPGQKQQVLEQCQRRPCLLGLREALIGLRAVSIAAQSSRPASLASIRLRFETGSPNIRTFCPIRRRAMAQSPVCQNQQNQKLAQTPSRSAHKSPGRRPAGGDGTTSRGLSHCATRQRAGSGLARRPALSTSPGPRIRTAPDHLRRARGR